MVLHPCSCCPFVLECSLFLLLIIVISQDSVEEMSLPQRSLLCSFLLPQKQAPLPAHFTLPWVIVSPPLYLYYFCGSWSPSTLHLCPLAPTYPKCENVNQTLLSIIIVWGSNRMLKEKQINGREEYYSACLIQYFLQMKKILLKLCRKFIFLFLNSGSAFLYNIPTFLKGRHPPQAR